MSVKHTINCFFSIFNCTKTRLNINNSWRVVQTFLQHLCFIVQHNYTKVYKISNIFQNIWICLDNQDFIYPGVKENHWHYKYYQQLSQTRVISYITPLFSISKVFPCGFLSATCLVYIYLKRLPNLSGQNFIYHLICFITGWTTENN